MVRESDCSSNTHYRVTTRDATACTHHKISILLLHELTLIPLIELLQGNLSMQDSDPRFHKEKDLNWLSLARQVTIVWHQTLPFDNSPPTNYQTEGSGARLKLLLLVSEPDFSHGLVPRLRPFQLEPLPAIVWFRDYTRYT